MTTPSSLAQDPKSFRTRQKEVREDAILSAAEELLSKQDFASVTMDDVAVKVGISKATLYQHFLSKEDLVVHMITRCMKNAESSIEQLDPALSPLMRLKKAFRVILEGRLGGIPGLRAARPALSPLIRSHPKAKAQYQDLFTALSNLVDAAKKEGGIRRSVPTELFVELFFAQVRSTDYEELVAEKKTSISEVCDFILTVLFDGVIR